MSENNFTSIFKSICDEFLPIFSPFCIERIDMLNRWENGPLLEIVSTFNFKEMAIFK